MPHTKRWPATLGDYNAAVAAASDGIAAQKEKVKVANVAAIEKELAGLNLVKLRHDQKITLLCTDCTALAADKDKLDKDNETAKGALDGHADKMIRAYEATINKLLKGFGAGFTITNSKKTYIGGTPTSVYQILINDHAVDLGEDATTPVFPGLACRLAASS